MRLDLSKLVTDPFLEERLQEAQSRAVRAATGVIEDEYDLEIQLRCFLSDTYNMPIMDSYFDRPLDDLAFEAYLIAERNKIKNTQPDSLVKDSLEEAAEYAAEGWEDFEMPNPLSDEEKQKMTDFMNTSTFIGEQK